MTCGGRCRRYPLPSGDTPCAKSSYRGVLSARLPRPRRPRLYYTNGIMASELPATNCKTKIRPLMSVRKFRRIFRIFPRHNIFRSNAPRRGCSNMSKGVVGAGIWEIIALFSTFRAGEGGTCACPTPGWVVRQRARHWCLC